MVGDSPDPMETRITLLINEELSRVDKEKKQKKKPRTAVSRAACCCASTTRYTYLCCKYLIVWRWLWIFLIFLIAMVVFCVKNNNRLRSWIYYWKHLGRDVEQEEGFFLFDLFTD